MKKIFSIICLCLLSVFVFAGCEAEGSTTSVGVKFVQEVFYVDEDTKTYLEYKVYPKTSKNYYVSYKLEEANVLLDPYYNFDPTDGSVTMRNSVRYAEISKSTGPVRVKVIVGDYSDTCEIWAKEYPTDVWFDKAEDYVDSGLVHSLNLQGEFVDGDRLCGNNEFVYKVTSSDPSVITIEDENSLLVRSTGRRGSSEITVQVCNKQGKEIAGLRASIILNITESIESAFATFGKLFVIENGETPIDLTLSEGAEYKLDVKYFDENNFVIDIAKFDCYLSNDNVFEIIEKADGVYLKVKILEEEPLEQTGEGADPLADEEDMGREVTITIQSRNTSASGDIVKIKRTLIVHVL